MSFLLLRQNSTMKLATLWVSTWTLGTLPLLLHLLYITFGDLYLLEKIPYLPWVSNLKDAYHLLLLRAVSLVGRFLLRGLFILMAVHRSAFFVCPQLL